MRRRRSTKQRFWLGTYRYCGCCRDTATNPDSDSYTTNDGDSMRRDTYTDCYSYRHGDPDCDRYSDSNSYSYSYSYGDSYGNTDVAHAYADLKPKADSNSEGHSGTAASPKSAPSAVIPLIPRIGEAANRRNGDIAHRR